MIYKMRGAVVVTAAMAALACNPVQSQQPAAKAQPPARPANPAANLPSDSGSQTTLPSGAVTGAGQPQGTGVQPDVGSPGGLERRARRAERRAPGDAARVPAAGGAESGTATEGPARRTRPARQSKG